MSARPACALPLWQPWATLVAIGAKRVETRSWPAPMYVRGQRIAIHATKGGLGIRRECELLERAPEFGNVLAPALGMPGATSGELVHALPRGALVATATLTRCTQITEAAAAALRERCPIEHAFGDYTPGRFAWVLDDAEAIDPPIPARGHQGVFALGRDLLTRLGDHDTGQGALL